MTTESRTPAADYLRTHFHKGEMFDSASLTPEQQEEHRRAGGDLSYFLHIADIHVCSLGSVIRSYGMDGAKEYETWHRYAYGEIAARYNDLPDTTAENAAARVARWEYEREGGA